MTSAKADLFLYCALQVCVHSTDWERSEIPKMDETYDPTPQKLPKLGCIIHCTDDNSKPATLQGLESWKTLHRAAKIRKHTKILEIANGLGEGEVPDIQYHRKCRSIFTMKKDLRAISNQGKQKKKVL